MEFKSQNRSLHLRLSSFSLRSLGDNRWVRQQYVLLGEDRKHLSQLLTPVQDARGQSMPPKEGVPEHRKSSGSTSVQFSFSIYSVFYGEFSFQSLWITIHRCYEQPSVELFAALNRPYGPRSIEWDDIRSTSFSPLEAKWPESWTNTEPLLNRTESTWPPVVTAGNWTVGKWKNRGCHQHQLVDGLSWNQAQLFPT